MDRYEQAAEDLLAGIDDDVRRRLSDDPFASIHSDFGLAITSLPAGSGREECSCDGAFYQQDGKIVVAETPFSRRSSFTAVHELGHYLVWSAGGDLLSDLYAWDPDNGGRIAEERVCDAIAAAILVPRDLVDEILADGGVRAEALMELFRRSGGSREACAVRLAQRLPSEGHVMLTRPDGTAIFTASTSLYRVGRGVQQGHDHISVRAGRLGKSRQESFVRFRSGRTQSMWGDAVLDENFVYVILSDPPPWPIDGVTILRGARDRAEPLDGECSICTAVFQSYDTPCPKCGSLRCPECGRCECSAIREQVCTSCFLRLPAHLFAEGSNVCHNCS